MTPWAPTRVGTERPGPTTDERSGQDVRSAERQPLPHAGSFGEAAFPGERHDQVTRDTLNATQDVAYFRGVDSSSAMASRV